MANIGMKSSTQGHDIEDARERARHPELNLEQISRPNEERVPFDILLGSSTGELLLERHATLLGDARLSHPANARHMAQIVTQLQQYCGNRHVQRAIAQVRDTSEKCRIRRDEGANNERLVEDRELINDIEASKGSGQPLDTSTLQEADASFGENFKDVRVHTDATANNLVNSLHANAFTTGRDIFFAQGVYQPQTHMGARIIGHELTHLSGGKTRGKVGFWGPGAHWQLTEAAVEYSGLKKHMDVIQIILTYLMSNKMDLTVRRTIQVLPQGAIGKLKRWWYTNDIRARIVKIWKSLGVTEDLFDIWLNEPDLREICKCIVGYRKQGILTADEAHTILEQVSKQLGIVLSGEGPQHGEGLNYTVWDPMPNIHANVRLQNEFLNEALMRFWDEEDVHLGVIIPLGHALHIAQDRGAHSEGEKGKGHSYYEDPEYDPDDPKQNSEGYQQASRNSLEVLNWFCHETYDQKEKYRIAAKETKEKQDLEGLQLRIQEEKQRHKEKEMKAKQDLEEKEREEKQRHEEKEMKAKQDLEGLPSRIQGENKPLPPEKMEKQIEDLVKWLKDTGAPDSVINYILQNPSQIAKDALRFVSLVRDFPGLRIAFSLYDLLTAWNKALVGIEFLLRPFGCKGWAYGATSWVFGGEHEQFRNQLTPGDVKSLKGYGKENLQPQANKIWIRSVKQGYDEIVQKYLEIRRDRKITGEVGIVFKALIAKEFNNDPKKMAKELYHSQINVATAGMQPAIKELAEKILSADYPE